MRKYILWIGVFLCLLFSGCGDQATTELKAENDVKTLTLAVFQSEYGLKNTSLSQWVNLYNENHSDVQIEIVNYLDNNTDFSEVLSKLKIEINAGKGPDIVNFGAYYSPLDASCGMMVDLYPYMQNDDSFNKQDYYYNILEAFEVGESLYVIVPKYRITSFATINEKLAGLDRMEIAQLIDAYNELDQESILIPGETKGSVFGMICYGSLENYIDWGKGTCNFNSDSFLDVLNFSNRFPLELNISEDYSAKKIFTEGRAILFPVGISSAYELACTRMLYGKTPTYIGYPVDSGCGNMAAIEDIALGISATSKNKEEAWEFIRSFLDSEFQDNIQNGLPLRVSSLEQKLEDAMKTEYDVNGNKVAKEYIRFDGEEPISIYEITEEDAELLKNIISKVEFNETVDYNLYNIIFEEAEYLFNEDRKAEDVADIIQNRVGIYISESK